MAEDTSVTTIKELVLRHHDLAIELDLTLTDHLPKRVKKFAAMHMSEIHDSLDALIDKVGYLPILAAIHDSMIKDIIYMYSQESYYDIDRLIITHQLTEVFQAMSDMAELKS